MKLFVYSVCDSASKVFDTPRVFNSDEEAMRAFGDLASNDETLIGKHPEHFGLYRIGTFDSQTGQIESSRVECILTAVVAVNPQPAVDNYGGSD